jgi:hypothetical protein
MRSACWPRPEPGDAMMELEKGSYRTEWWERRLEELDRELGRQALLCRVPLLEPGVVDRVLHGDRSVCGTDNRLAFEKLVQLLRMHLVIRQKTADELGQRRTMDIETYVIERLRKSFPDIGSHWPPV